MAALSAQAPTRPIDPVNPAADSSRTNALDPLWLLRSECTVAVVPPRRATALRRAATARDAFMRELME